jgi:hypothetical protein
MLSAVGFLSRVPITISGLNAMGIIAIGLWFWLRGLV